MIARGIIGAESSEIQDGPNETKGIVVKFDSVVQKQISKKALKFHILAYLREKVLVDALVRFQRS